MGTKKRGVDLGRIKGFSIQFLPYSEIKDLDSDQRIKKILSIVLGNNILIIQGKLRADEETRLIGDTMAMIGHVTNFKGIELAVITGSGEGSIYDKMKLSLANLLTGGNVNAITIIGPATIVKEIKKNPRKIELLLDSR
jgi:hypothetical protein